MVTLPASPAAISPLDQHQDPSWPPAAGPLPTGDASMEPATTTAEAGSRQRQRQQRRVSERERKRAVKACDGCRRLKEKCDGGVPCRRCVRLRRPCEFLGPPISRTAAPESASSAAARPQSSDRDDSSSELAQRVAYLETLLQHYAGDIRLDSDNLRHLVDHVEKKDPSSAAAGAAAAGRPPGESESDSDYLAAEDEGFIVQPIGNNVTHYSGEFSHFIFSMRIKEWIEQSMPRSENAEARGYKEFYRVQSLQSSSATFTSLESLPPRFVADFLVEAFFRHAETNYFYVERDWLHGRLDLAYHNPAALNRLDAGTVCIIFIVLAIGTQFAYLDSPPRRDHDAAAAAAAATADDDESGTTNTAFSEDALGIVFYQQACKLVPDVITVANLESVQACLLIGLYTLPLDASGLSYNYLNLAIKLAIQNGMHRRYLGEGLDPVTRETRSRVWWTAYTTERRVAIFHGRPISVPISDIDAEMPRDLPDVWPCSSPTHVQSMLASVEIHRMLSRMSQEISLLKIHAKKGAFDTLSRLINLKNDLRAWWDSLPANICRSPSALAASSTPITRSEAHLRLEYCLARMFAGRPFIFLRGTPGGGGGGGPGGGSSTSPVETTQRQHRSSSGSTGSPRKGDSSKATLVTDCVDAALDVIDTCRLVRDDIGLARGSYTEFSSIRSALLVLIARCCLQGKTDRLRQSLRDGVAMIKTLSVGGESAPSEAALIEMLERAIARLGTPDLGTPTPTAAPESDYDRFKRWEMLWQSEPYGSDAASADLTAPSAAAAAAAHGEEPMPPLFGAGGRRAAAGGGAGVGLVAAQEVPPAAAMDWEFASFPQNMDEFSAMFGQGLGQSPGEFVMGDALWMGQQQQQQQQQ